MSAQKPSVCAVMLFLVLGWVSVVWAQSAPAAPAAGTASTTVPRLVKFSGTVKDADGKPRTGVTGITFALYKEQEGGAALWLETQSVTTDAQGQYVVLLGSTAAAGIPMDAFSANEARWLGVQPEGQAEQRVLLVSVPYALKAADAETLGGIPASSFVLATPMASSGAGSSASAGNSSANSAAGSATNGVSPATTCSSGSCAVSTSAPGGTANFVPLFTDPTTVQNSVLSQSPCPFDNTQTCLGIENPNPTRILDVNGEVRVGGGNIFLQRNLTDLLGRRNWALGSETFNVGDVSLFVSTSNTANPSVPVLTALSNGFMGIGVATPRANLEIAGSVGGGLLVDGPGVITGNGSGLTNLNAANLTGTLPSSTLSGVNGSALTNVNAFTLQGYAPSNFANLGSSNQFVGGQSIYGNLFVDGPVSGASLTLPNTTSSSAGVITLGGTPFLHNFGVHNTFVGALAGNMTTMNAAVQNTAVGYNALTANTTGAANSALGYDALAANTTASENSAFGNGALAANTTGTQNSAFGSAALLDNTTGFGNSAFGALALNSNAGINNSAFGRAALTFNSTGNNNAAFGYGALTANTTAAANSGFGYNALAANTTGQFNSAFGYNALNALLSGGGNIAIGQGAGSQLNGAESNNIYIGNAGVAGESGVIRIGLEGSQIATFVAGISGTTSSSGVAVFVNSAGQLGTVTSSRRFKHEIADMGAESDLLMKLRPVAFYYKPELDQTQTRQYGLVAEEVAQVAPQLVVYDQDGAPQTVRYHFVNAMLLNAVQKQQRLLEEQRTTIGRQESRIQDLEARLAKLEAALAEKH